VLDSHEHDVVATGLERDFLAGGQRDFGDGSHPHHVVDHHHFVDLDLLGGR
jgi:hypothetical protein